MQIATLQGQIAEIQRASEESRAELRRLTELIAEQNALLKKSVADRRQQDEAVAASLKELGDRVAEVAEALDAIRAQATPLLTPLPAADAAAGGHPRGRSRDARRPSRRPRPRPRPPGRPRPLASSTARPTPTTPAATTTSRSQGFAEYIRNYPGTDFTDNAQYWIGECLYGKKMYAEAIEAWNTLFKDYPASDKLPDARVKKGMALERLGRKSQALVEYRYVVDRYPNSQAARIARERLTP